MLNRFQPRLYLSGQRRKSKLIDKAGAIRERPNGNPFTLKLTEVQAHDDRSADDILVTVGNNQTLLADRTYDSGALRVTLTARGTKLTPN